MDPTNGMTDFRKRPQQAAEVETTVINEPLPEVEIVDQLKEVTKPAMPSFIPAALRNKQFE